LENKIVITLEAKRSLSDIKSDDLVRITDFFDSLSFSDGLKELKYREKPINTSLNYFYVTVDEYRLIYKYSDSNILTFFSVISKNVDITNLEVKWYDVYTCLARMLSKFYLENKKESSSKLIKLIDLEHDNFYELNPWSKNRIDLDPIDVFSSFNTLKISTLKRVNRINLFFATLCNYCDVRFVPFNSIDFRGCPSMYGGNILVGREPCVQEVVWEVFNNAVTKGEIFDFDLEMVKSWYGVGIPSFTMFLFWINYRNFMPLDKNTTSILIANGAMKKVPNETSEYLELITEKNTNKYIELSIYSYDEAYSKNYYDLSESCKSFDEPKSLNKSIESKLESSTIDQVQSGASQIASFGIVAIRPLDGCNDSYLKTLKSNEYYLLNDSYTIKDGSIIYNPKEDFNLHSIEGLNINISAIVGKNGTGKSTLTELVYVAINNLSHRISDGKLDVFYADDVYVELYVKLDIFYCIRIEGKNISAISYNFKDGIYIPNENNEISNLELSNLFYTISINYSQHAMNCSDNNDKDDWLNKLFHKNDAYQTPIVIEPFREKGNIDVNQQEMLVKQRLLVNLLEPNIDDSVFNNHRKLGEYNYATGIKLKLDYSKFKYVYKTISGHKTLFDDFSNIIIESLYLIRDFFDISSSRIPKLNTQQCKTIEDYVELYIFKKLINISITYKLYNEYYDQDTLRFNNLRAFLTELSKDNSHITFKLNQALNLLKDRFSGYDDFSFTDGVKLSLDEYTDYISNKKKIDSSLKSVNLVPPSCFNIDIILDENISFQSLSSGEKQKIYTLNSIYYHLNNIASVHSELINYRYVNLILDEVELYFHPELQRNYINDLIDGISKIDVGGIFALNIIFVTHSPFIISDITESRVLFLTKDSPTEKSLPLIKEDKIKTFGANIHELLVSGFFMDNSIGQFSLSCIEQVVEFHDKVLLCEDMDSLKSEFRLKESMFDFVVSNIGEEYIKRILTNHLEDIRRKLDFFDSHKQRRIIELQEELRLLQGNDFDTN